LSQGTIKEYDPRSRTGTLFMDDESEVHIDATSVEGAGIRILRIGQRVKFDVADVGGKKTARTLRIVTFD
jgi:2-phospho-L-lactate guanylyltransferase